ncbi:DNA gyrase inhibitor YacG [Methylobrevis pamukkalensis]|uniref:DNA gyrase inhibitor YacG n=1 Tax=Methylobrevis pamukkalensis TaxID=1439726 RepID=A0A1E3H176_9HYPH|nr:DNA gyrase inhibitor YacG [Methylobrevis pamukkalensis]ODN69566.1 DNA gyrase inhibitor YacG [Methylobrevis pamukkalensis]
MTGNTSSGRRCPTCGAPTDPGFRPFCSKRCADVDLHRWFSGSYRIPVVATGTDEDESLPEGWDDPGRKDDGQG